MNCEHCSNPISIYGYTVEDILKIDKWLSSQNATIKDLDGSSLSWHFYAKQKVMDYLSRDFR